MRVLASVEGRNEDNVVPFLKLVFLLALKFPISIINEDQDAGPPISSRQFCFAD